MPKIFPVINTYVMGQAVRSHVVDATTSIYGFANPGTATTDAKWKMFKIIDDGTDLSQTWADGNDEYDNIWANYATETFS